MSDKRKAVRSSEDRESIEVQLAIKAVVDLWINDKLNDTDQEVKSMQL